VKPQAITMNPNTNHNHLDHPFQGVAQGVVASGAGAAGAAVVLA
jgi:hypothetical protein